MTPYVTINQLNVKLSKTARPNVFVKKL